MDNLDISNVHYERLFEENIKHDDMSVENSSKNISDGNLISIIARKFILF